MNSTTSLEIKQSYDTLKDQALENSNKSLAAWTKYKTDLDHTKSLLLQLPKKLSHSVMVPLGPKALVPGRIVHTNEFLVNLGDTWYAKRSAWQALQICNRRITNCNEVITKIEREKKFLAGRSALIVEQEAFGTMEAPEIVEYATEEEHEEWKTQHKIKVKSYMQQLMELRNKKRTPVKTQEDLWKRLDELQLQEELEDELDRIDVDGSEIEDEYYNKSKKYSPLLSSTTSQRTLPTAMSSKKESVDKGKRRVSFACDVEDPLRLEIKHSNVKPGPSYLKNQEITSPSDIYEAYLNSSDRQPASVFKGQDKPIMLSNTEGNSDMLQYSENVTPPLFPVKDIKEKTPSDTSVVSDTEGVEKTSKKISKFKQMKTKPEE